MFARIGYKSIGTIAKPIGKRIKTGTSTITKCSCILSDTIQLISERARNLNHTE